VKKEEEEEEDGVLINFFFVSTDLRSRSRFHYDDVVGRGKRNRF
jgi:hypothetical protein